MELVCYKNHHVAQACGCGHVRHAFNSSGYIFLHLQPPEILLLQDVFYNYDDLTYIANVH